MDKVVGRYLKRNPGERLYEIEMEFLVLQWLTDVAAGNQKVSEEPERTLALASFIDTITVARVAIEDAA